ncbi:MAG: hypothetical protein JW384_02267 [Nitrosomonadaceae bacterium]|nr:hypothetical protein [Nitrosomonadaceae bacterium]
MHVLDVVMNDEDDTLKNCAYALMGWYWHIKKVPFHDSDSRTLQALAERLHACLQAFVSFGCSLSFPKYHCARKIAVIIANFGPYQHVSSDSFERAHKALKAVYLRYTLSLPICPLLSHDACRSNRLNITGDITRDICRKRKIQMLQGIRPSTTLYDTGGDTGVLMGLAHKRRAREMCSMDEAHEFLPSRGEEATLHLPRRTWTLRERLGVFLSDGARLPVRDYPAPDGGGVVIPHVRARLAVAAGAHGNFLVHSSRSFHGKPAFSWVEVNADGTLWYGRVLALLTLTYKRQTFEVALIMLLRQLTARENPYPASKAYTWWSPFPDVFTMDKLRRVVTIVHAKDLPGKDPVFLLLDH